MFSCNCRFGSGSIIHIYDLFIYSIYIICMCLLSTVAGQMLSITVSSVESRGRAWNDVNRHDARIEQCGCLTNRSIHSTCCWENRLGEMETEPNLSWICWVCWAWFRQNNFWEFDGICVNSVIRLTVCKSIFSPMCAFSSIWNFCWKLLQYQMRCLLVPPSIVSITSFGLCQANGNRLLHVATTEFATERFTWRLLIKSFVLPHTWCCETHLLRCKDHAAQYPQQFVFRPRTAANSRRFKEPLSDCRWHMVTTTNDHLLLVPRSAFLDSCFASGNTWIE